MKGQKRKRKKKMLSGVLLFFLLPLSALSQFVFDDALTAGNPFRGFMAYTPGQGSTYTSDLKSSLEFSYFPLKAVNTAANVYDWTVVEKSLSGAASRKRHAIIRFYLDFPSLPSGIPAYLGVKTTKYTVEGGGSSPDYNNAGLQTALVNFIAALGRKYDTDRRLAAVEVGYFPFFV